MESSFDPDSLEVGLDAGLAGSSLQERDKRKMIPENSDTQNISNNGT